MTGGTATSVTVGRGSGMRRTAGFLLLSLAAAAFAFGAYLLTTPQRGADNHGGWRRAAPGVEVAPAGLHRFVDRIEALGTARASESVTLTAQVTETVARIHFADGQTVRKGTILLELDHAEEDAQLAEAEAALQEAERQLARIRELVARGNATKAAFDEQMRNVAQARARMAQVQARIATRVIRAPFDGVLGLRQVSVGALVTPGDVITTIDDITPILLDFSVPERFLSALAVGQTIRARAAAFPDRLFTGRIVAIAPRVDPVTRAVTVRAELPNADQLLRPGMLLEVAVIGRTRHSLAVPEEALLLIGRQHYVYVIRPDGTADRRQVTIGQRLPGIVEITNGLAAGEKVVVAGILRLRPGVKARILKAHPPAGGPSPAAVSG